MDKMTEQKAKEIFLEVLKTHKPLMHEINELAGICPCCDEFTTIRLALNMHFCHSCQVDLLDKIEAEIKSKYSPNFITRGHGSTVIHEGSITLGFGWIFGMENEATPNDES